MDYDDIKRYMPLLHAVAAEMGPTWAAVLEVDRYRDSVLLTDGKLSMDVSTDDHRHQFPADAPLGRLALHGDAPNADPELGGYTRHKHDYPRTTVAGTRTPRAIAAQLQRIMVAVMIEREAEFAAARVRADADLVKLTTILTALAPWGADVQAGLSALRTGSNHTYVMPVNLAHTGSGYRKLTLRRDGTADLSLDYLEPHQLLGALNGTDGEHIATVLAALNSLPQAT